MRKFLLLLLSALPCLLLVPRGTLAQQGDAQVPAITGVDVSRYPQVTLSVDAPPGPLLPTLRVLEDDTPILPPEVVSETLRVGVSVVVLVDLSSSMLTADVPTGRSRLDNGKELIRALSAQLDPRHDFLSLIAFSREVTPTLSLAPFNGQQVEQALGALPSPIPWSRDGSVATNPFLKTNLHGALGLALGALTSPQGADGERVKLTRKVIVIVGDSCHDLEDVIVRRSALACDTRPVQGWLGPNPDTIPIVSVYLGGGSANSNGKELQAYANLSRGAYVDLSRARALGQDGKEQFLRQVAPLVHAGARRHITLTYTSPPAVNKPSHRLRVEVDGQMAEQAFVVPPYPAEVEVMPDKHTSNTFTIQIIRSWAAIERVEVFRDGGENVETRKRDSDTLYQFDLAGFEPGWHTIKARVTDSSQRATTVTLGVTVINKTTANQNSLSLLLIIAIIAVVLLGLWLITFFTWLPVLRPRWSAPPTPPGQAAAMPYFLRVRSGGKDDQIVRLNRVELDVWIDAQGDVATGLHTGQGSYVHINHKGTSLEVTAMPTGATIYKNNKALTGTVPLAPYDLLSLGDVVLQCFRGSAPTAPQQEKEATHGAATGSSAR